MMSAAQEHIGYCELCGEVDHHLEHGVCPDCQPKVAWHADSDITLLVSLLTDDQVERVRQSILSVLPLIQADLHIKGIVYALPDTSRLDEISPNMRARIARLIVDELEGRPPALLQEQAF